MGLISAMPYNFYPILVIAVLFFLIISGKDFGPMKSAEIRVREGKMFDEGSRPMVSEEITFIKTKKGVKANSLNMFIPLFLMVVTMPFMLFYTGYNKELIDSNLLNTFFSIIGNASGSASVLYSVLTALIFSSFYY